MPPRVRCFFVSALLIGLASGCLHRARSHGPDSDNAARSSQLSAQADVPAPPAVTRRSVPGTPFTRAQAEQPFDPRLVVTTQVAHDDLFLHVVSNPDLRYQAAGRIHRGQRVFILPIARNYAFDALENVDLTYELTIRRPDGTIAGTPISASLWQGIVSAPDLILYPTTTISFFCEPHDPTGPYDLVVRIHDHLGETTRELVHRIEVVDYTPPGLPADFQPDRWFHGYYLQPTPELALPALPRFFDKLPSDKRAGAIPPLLGFYDQILGDNPWLLPAFGQRLGEAAPDEAFALSLVLGFHLRGLGAPPDGISQQVWERLADFRTNDWPADPDAPLLTASQLDALWGRFFASALYAPVQRLLEPLAHTGDLGAAERWRAATVPVTAGAADAPDAADPFFPDLEDPGTPDEIRREVLLRTALWTLRANARQHPLVRGYLEQTLRAGDLAPGARYLLERALTVDSAPAATAAAAPSS